MKLIQVAILGIFAASAMLAALGASAAPVNALSTLPQARGSASMVIPAYNPHYPYEKCWWQNGCQYCKACEKPWGGRCTEEYCKFCRGKPCPGVPLSGTGEYVKPEPKKMKPPPKGPYEYQLKPPF